MEIAEIPEFNKQSAHQSNRMTQMQSSHQRRKNLALSCTVLCAVGAAATLLPDGLSMSGGPFGRLVNGRKLRASKQRRLQLAAADYSALLAANAPAGGLPAMGAPAMGAAPVAAGIATTGGDLSDADIAKFLAKYDLELKDLELLQKLREGYVKADGSSSVSSASAGSASTPTAMAAGAAPPVPEPPATPAAPPVDYAAMLGTPATSAATTTSSVSTPEAAAAPAAPAAPATTTTSSTSTPLAVPLGPIEDCSAEADNWLQNFCELKNFRNKFGDCNVSFDSYFWLAICFSRHLSGYLCDAASIYVLAELSNSHITSLNILYAHFSFPRSPTSGTKIGFCRTGLRSSGSSTTSSWRDRTIR